MSSFTDGSETEGNQRPRRSTRERKTTNRLNIVQYKEADLSDSFRSNHSESEDEESESEDEESESEDEESQSEDEESESEDEESQSEDEESQSEDEESENEISEDNGYKRRSGRKRKLVNRLTTSYLGGTPTKPRKRMSKRLQENKINAKKAEQHALYVQRKKTLNLKRKEEKKKEMLRKEELKIKEISKIRDFKRKKSMKVMELRQKIIHRKKNVGI